MKNNRKSNIFFLAVTFMLIFAHSVIETHAGWIGDSFSEVKNELQGTAKPEGGIDEAVPSTKSFSASHTKIWEASQEILDEWGYIYEANQSTNMIKTEPKYLNDTNEFRFIGSDYAAKLYITINGQNVKFLARFNKQSNLVKPTENAEFPEKENELRKLFFDTLSKKL